MADKGIPLIMADKGISLIPHGFMLNNLWLPADRGVFLKIPT